MTIRKTVIIKGRYYDSVTLMNVAKSINHLPGVVDSAVVMGTAANKDILKNSGIYAPEFDAADDSDLLIAVTGVDATLLEASLAAVDRILCDLRTKQKKGNRKGVFRPRSLEGAIQVLPDANLAMISIAGQYAGDEAMKALQRGMHVMLFSDNVSLEKEVELKRYAHEHGLLVMGPDCGTAIINGAPLAFANVVNSGSVGVVAAAGTGLQEVTSLISNYGAGISQAIGTGGRDVKREVGGISFVDALCALAAHDDTKTIVLVSKPVHAEVMERIGRVVARISKPVIGVFLGADRQDVARHGGILPASTLEEVALLAVALTEGGDPVHVGEKLCGQRADLQKRASLEAVRLSPSQKYVRGLFSGGTFCYEAQMILQETVESVWSNTPAASVKKLADAHKSTGHTVVDLGDDAFTVGKPHPMIDFSMRNKRIVAEAKDPETAVILLDLVLGYGSNEAPLVDLLPALEEAQTEAGKAQRHLPMVCSVTGTDEDPQHRGQVVKALEAAGVRVERSNAAACLLAASLVAGR